MISINKEKLLKWKHEIDYTNGVIDGWYWESLGMMEHNGVIYYWFLFYKKGIKTQHLPFSDSGVKPKLTNLRMAKYLIDSHNL